MKYLLVKFWVMIDLLYALLARFWYYLETSSLLVLAQYRHSGVFSVGSNFSLWESWLCISRLEKCRRKKLLFIAPPSSHVRRKLRPRQEKAAVAWRGGHSIIDDVGLALDRGLVLIGPFCKLQNAPYLEWHCILIKSIWCNI